MENIKDNQSGASFVECFFCRNDVADEKDNPRLSVRSKESIDFAAAQAEWGFILLGSVTGLDAEAMKHYVCPRCFSILDSQDHRSTRRLARKVGKSGAYVAIPKAEIGKWVILCWDAGKKKK